MYDGAGAEQNLDVMDVYSQHHPISTRYSHDAKVLVVIETTILR